MQGGYIAGERVGLCMTRRTADHARPPCPTTTTTATRHGSIFSRLARALFEPILLFGTCQIGLSTEFVTYQKPRPPIRVSIPRVLGLQPSPVSHVSQYRTKTLSRTYLYDLVCDVTRFTHFVTSHSADNVVRMTRGLANPRSGELWVWGIRHTHNPNPA